jgi:predicted enzyme related to lactoylglutathione lyase
MAALPLAISEIITRVGQLGGTVSIAPYELADVGRIAVLNDPEGAVFSVIQRLGPEQRAIPR